MTSNPEGSKNNSTDPDTLCEAMDPLTPYTTDELAEELSLPRKLLNKWLKQLANNNKITEKTSDTARSSSIWIRDPQQIRCPKCDRVYKIQPVHSVLGSIKFCPECGTQLKK